MRMTSRRWREISLYDSRQKRYDCDYGQGESAVPSRDWYLSSLPNIIKEKMWNQRAWVCIRPPHMNLFAWSFGDGGAGQRGQQYNEEGFGLYDDRNQDPNVTSADVIRIFAGVRAGRF